jgi:RNA polymerase sigma-70 factor (ECF subfamily)
VPALAGRPPAETVRRDVHDHVLRFVARRVRSLEDAEDITQNVMLRLHRAELEEIEQIEAWVHRVALNAIADHYRRAVRRELPSGQVIERPELVEPAPADADSDALRGELAACLAPLIERLRPIYRQALELADLDGLSQVDAAARLGLSASGMKARVQRARQQLRVELLACCEVELDRRRRVTDVRSRGVPCGTCGQR